jgi:diguanylate cyclase (GGDEF)-like protein
MAGTDRRLWLLAAPLVLLGGLLAGTSVVAWQSQQQEERLSRAFAETSEYLTATHAVEHATLQMIRGQRGFLLTGKPRYLEPYREGLEEMDQTLAQLSGFARAGHGNPVDVERLAAQSAAFIRVQQEIVDLASNGNRDEALTIVLQDRGRAAIESIRSLLKTMRAADELRMATIRTDAQRNQLRQRLFFYLVSAVGLALLVLTAVSLLALRRVAASERLYREELRRLAQTDELTGIANRRELIAGLARALADSQRTDRELAFALLDIDHFKRVNDTYGHPAGDEVIRNVAHIALSCLRGGDMVGRLGGEEFGLVLLGASVTQAYEVCERVRRSIQSTPVKLADGSEVEITVSLGIARRFPGDSVETLIERADAALYQAKHSGRDQVRLAA